MKQRNKESVKPNLFLYRITQAVSLLVSRFFFKRKLLRNEIKGKKGPFVIIANHQAALDFVNLIGITHRPMSFVVSHSFFNTLPVKGVMRRIGVIPKQQFQTSMSDIRKMKAVIDGGGILTLYPAGLMCEDGLSTPIPEATYQFLKWIRADIYVAKTYGTYFAMPKWSKGIRPGRTYLDVYKLFSREELADMDPETVRARANEALLFDAYREQEKLMVSYKNGGNIEGLENVLYMCPRCKTEFSMQVENQSTIRCTHCGFEQESDKHAFLHNRKSPDEEIRYVSDWSRLIYGELKEKIRNGAIHTLSSATDIHMIDKSKNKFVKVGEGNITLTADRFHLSGTVNGAELSLSVPSGSFASLPFSPGRYMEVQQGDIIYRCVLRDGRLAMKFVNMVKIFYELAAETRQRTESRARS